MATQNKSKGKYHLLPHGPTPLSEAAKRPSTSTLSSCSNSNTSQDRSIGFKNLHLTIVLRLLAFGLFLPADILLFSSMKQKSWRGGNWFALESIYFLSFALVRNIWVLVRERWDRTSTVSVKLQNQETGVAMSGKGWASKVFSDKVLQFIIDLSICFGLFIALVMDKAKNRVWEQYDWIPGENLAGYIVAFVGLPFYFMAIIDCGVPSSVALSVHLKVMGQKDDEQPDEVPASEYREAETPLPGEAEHEQATEARNLST